LNGCWEIFSSKLVGWVKIFQAFTWRIFSICIIMWGTKYSHYVHYIVCIAKQFTIFFKLHNFTLTFKTNQIKIWSICSPFLVNTISLNVQTMTWYNRWLHTPRIRYAHIKHSRGFAMYVHGIRSITLIFNIFRKQRVVFVRENQSRRAL